MKVLAIVLLCAFAAVQGRSAGASNTRTLATLGEHPHIVHLRIAVATSGFLNTCAGSLIGSRWVLTAASCVQDVRFIWTRYGVVSVINPSLVTESSANNVHPDANVAVLSIGRDVETTENIAPVTVIGGDVPDSANICVFGSDDVEGPGEQLTCFDVTLEKVNEDEYRATSEDGAITKFDIGTPILSDGVQFGIVVGAGPDNSGIVIPTARVVKWIEEQTSLTLAPESPDSEDSEDQSLRVKVVN